MDVILPTVDEVLFHGVSVNHERGFHPKTVG